MSLVKHFPVKEEETFADRRAIEYNRHDVHRNNCNLNDNVFWDLWEKGGICPVCKAVVKK